MTLATGGTVTDIMVGGVPYRVHTFTTSSDLVVTDGGEVEYLVVAGGGAGGRVVGGGGGGGGLLSGSTTVSIGTVGVTVGAGGAAPVTPGATAGSGGASEFSSITTVGGGGGSSFGNVPAAGGSGGGAGGRSSGTQAGGAGTAGQGNNGGSSTFISSSPLNRPSGGGGGAGAAGANSASLQCGNGGDGIASSITGTSTFYAGGGGGGADRNVSMLSGAGGLGGGGAGGTGSASVINGANGTDGLGGGGGGGNAAATGNDVGAGGAGGDGIVIIRYILSVTLNPQVLIGGVNFTGNTVGEVTVSRGRRTVYERTNAGFASIDLIDVTGIPTFTVGDEVEVRFPTGTLFKTIFTGTLSDWSSETTPARDRAIVRYRLQAVGPLATLNRRQILFDGRTSENDAERVGAVLTAALGTAIYNPALVDPGVFTLAALGSADAGYNALTTAQNAEFSGEGLLFETEDGNIGYQDADRRRTNERTEILTIPFATLSAEGIQVLQQLADITNTVTVSYEGGAATELDQGSIDTFGLFETELSTQLVNLSNAEARAGNFLSQHSVPSRNLEELRFRLRGVADDTLRDALLDVAVSDALEVTGVPEPVGFTQFRGFVEGVRLTVNDFDARLSLTVSDRRLSIAAERWGQVGGTIEWQNVDAALTWQNATEVTE